MNTEQIQKSLDDLRQEQARISEAIRTLEHLLSGSVPNRLSPEGRARISEAAKRRWEEHRQQAQASARSRNASSLKKAA